MTYRLLTFSLWLLSCIPFRMMYVLSDFLYYVVYYVVRYRRAVVRRNITAAFPEKSGREVVEVEKGFYRFFTDLILESGKLASISPEEMSRRMVFTNVDMVNASLREGKSIALYLGHYANWEWCSSMPLCLEKSIIAAQIYHALSNKDADGIILRNRERMGAVCVEMRKTARYVNELSVAGKVSLIGFIADQSPRKRDARHYLQFLNHEVPVFVGTEKLAKRYGFEAWFLNVRRVKRGYYEAEFVKMHDNPQALPDFELTAIYYNMLESMIRRVPELYLWSHKRFRHARPKA